MHFQRLFSHGYFVKVTPKKGKATNLKATITVKNPALSVKAAKEVAVGATEQITATVKPANTKVTYTSSDATLATVDEKGVVTGVKAGDVTITVKAGKTTKTVKMAVKETYEVKSVTPISATKVAVKFGCAVDETEAETTTNYALNGANPSAAELADDAKTVTLTFTAAQVELAADATVTVQPIKTVADATQKTKLYSAVFAKYADTVAPTVVSAEAKIGGTDTSAAKFTLTFSEPLSTKPSVKVDGVTVNAANVTYTNGDLTATVNTTVKAGQTYKVDVYNLVDQATTGNVTAQSSTTLTVAVDTTAPTVAVSAEGDSTIVYTFSKAMNKTTVDAAITAAAKVLKNATYADVNYTVTVYSVADKTVKLTGIGANMFEEKATTAVANVLVPTGMKDELGNVLVGGYMTSTTLLKDVTKPTFTGYKVTKDATGKVNGIEFAFSEDVTVTAANPTIVDENGVLITPSPVTGYNASKNVVTGTITPTNTLFGHKYTFTFAAGSFSDKATTPNTSDAFSVTVDFGAAAADTAAVTATVVGSNTAGNQNTITVTYSEAVTVSATNIANYSLNGASLPAGTTITLDAARKVATIKLPAGTVAAADATAALVITGVTTVSGKSVATLIKTVDVVDDTAAKLTGVQVMGNDLYLTFNEALDNTTATAIDNVAKLLANFAITVDGKDVILDTTTVACTLTGNGATKNILKVSLTPNGTHNWDNTKPITVAVKNTATLEGADEVVVATTDAITAK